MTDKALNLVLLNTEDNLMQKYQCGSTYNKLKPELTHIGYLVMEPEVKLTLESFRRYDFADHRV